MPALFIAPVLPALRAPCVPRAPRTVRCSAAAPDDGLVDDSSSELYLNNLLQNTDADANANARARRRPPARVPPPRAARPRPRPPPSQPTTSPGVRRQLYSPDLTRDADTDGDAAPRAPNGIPDGPPDLLQELIPRLAKEEQREARKLSEGEKELLRRVDACWDLHASMHKKSDRLGNLRPFRLREEAESVCDKCDGVGMTRCEYCQGDGFVDLGENAENFDADFKGNFLTLPKVVTGNIYHCPLCGGLREERCVRCYGTGVDPEREERKDGEAAEDVGDGAWQMFDVEELLEKEADRIEIGLDGTIVLRAKKPKRTGRKGNKAKEETKEEVNPTKMKEERPAKEARKVKKKRERPRKVENPKSGNDTNLRRGAEFTPRPTQPPTFIPSRRAPSKSTAFLNTTDYKVGRQLRRQAPAPNRHVPNVPLSVDDTTPAVQEQERGEKGQQKDKKQ